MKKRFSFMPLLLSFLRVSWLVTMLYAENVCSAQELTHLQASTKTRG